jgi:hypothetical protein
MKKKLKNSSRIYISAAMRGGSTLISNILNAHSDIQIIENFHFYRFLFDKKNLPTQRDIEFKIREMSTRLKIRYNIDINENNVLKNLNNTELTYKNIYDALILEQLNLKPKLKIVGEDSALNWRFIETFCSMYKNAKVIHLIRDPRSIYASWKKITYQKFDRWGCILNCIDSMNYAKKYQKKLSKKNYLVLRFEDVLRYPEKYGILISKFINVKFQKNMIQPKKWSDLFKNKFASLGWSSIENKSIDDFMTDRIDSWKRKLNNSEVEIIEYFAKKQLAYFKYELTSSRINNKNLIKFKDKVNKSKYLKKHFKNFLNTGEGTDKLRDNPLDPKTWGDGKKNKKKFINTASGKKYLNKIKKIKLKIFKK